MKDTTKAHQLLARLRSQGRKVAPPPEPSQAEEERDYLVEEYERAVGCGKQGYLHAAMHLYNAIVNARIEANGPPVAWRYWIHDDKNLLPFWTKWSTNVHERRLFEKLGYKADYAYGERNER